MSLLNQLLGNQELANIDNRVDNLVSKFGQIDNSESLPSSKNIEDLTGDFLGLVSDEESQEKNTDFEKLFADVNIPTERLSRYSTYDEIYKSISLTKRVISVYVANILSKNPVDNKTLIYKDENESDTVDENKQELSKEFAKKTVEKFDLVSRLKKTIIPNRLCYGDYFVEVVDINERTKDTNWETMNTKMNVVTECENIVSECQKSKNDIDRYLEKASEFLFEYHDEDPELQGVISDLEEEETSNNPKDEKQSYDLTNVLLKYHKPHNIIILETNYGTRLGFLEVYKNKDATHTGSISSMVQKVTNANNINSKDDPNKNVDKIIKYVISKVIGKSKQKGHNSRDVQSVLSSLDPEVFKFIKRMVVEQGYDREKTTPNVNPVRVRFIPPSKMVHFSNPGSADYAPFASSVLDPMVLPGKLYMLAQLSNTVTKLSRASLIRKWTIDTGPTKMTGNSLNKLKREIYNTRVTLNDLGSFKSMSKILSDFRDVFAVSNNGRTPVDFQIQQTGDPNVKTEDLKDLRQELVSLSGIPSAYLGMQDAVQLSEQLSHINQSFAVEISDQQENDIKSINDLIYKISKVAGLDFDPTDYTTVSLTPPIVLILQLIESTLNSVGNIAGIFGNLQIPVDPYYLLQQYVPQIDWDKFKEKAEQYQKEQAAKGGSNQEQQQGGGGMGW